MSQQIIGSIPEFTGDGDSKEEVKQVGTQEIQEVSPDETETHADLPSEEKPVEESVPDADTGNAEELVGTVDKSQIEGLQRERIKLLKEVQELRGMKRREITKEEILSPKQTPPAIEGVAPEDVALVNKIARESGLMSKEEVQRMFYESVKTDEVNKFLNDHPEYKPENDPNDLNWGALQRELSWYRMPDDPRRIRDILERAHQSTSAVPTASSERSLNAQKQRVKTASLGGGSTQRLSSQEGTKLTPRQRLELEHGGFTKEDIEQIEQGLK